MKKDIKKVLDEMQNYLEGMCYFRNESDQEFESGVGFCLKMIARKVGIDETNYGTTSDLDDKKEDDE